MIKTAYKKNIRLLWILMYSCILITFLANEPVEAVVPGNGEETVTYRNTEYGFEFQYPKTLTLSDGQKKEIDMEAVDLSKGGWKESLIFRLNSYTLWLNINVEKKPSDFSNLRSHVEQVYQRIDEIIEKDHFNPTAQRIFQQVETAEQQAILVVSFDKQLEATIFIEKRDFLYVMHNSCFYLLYSQEADTSHRGKAYTSFLDDICSNAKLPSIEQIIDTLTFDQGE